MSGGRMIADHDGSALEFRILGRLEISVAGREVPLPSHHVRWLLAVLLLSAGSTVTDEQLIRLVWGGSGTSLRALRTSVSRLRSWLHTQAGMAHAVKHSKSGGYVFDLRDEQVDAARFVDLHKTANGETTGRRPPVGEVGRGRSIGGEAGWRPSAGGDGGWRPSAGGDGGWRGAAGGGPSPDVSLGLLLEALEQWRGAVLEGAPASVRAHPQVLRLERARVACASRAADLALRAGRPEAVLRHLRELAVEAPFDEPLQARFIRLLGAAGRRAEGLRLFEEVRHRLADELGVDPSAELRAAHAHLLREDPPAARDQAERDWRVGTGDDTRDGVGGAAPGELRGRPPGGRPDGDLNRAPGGMAGGPPGALAGGTPVGAAGGVAGGTPDGAAGGVAGGAPGGTPDGAPGGRLDGAAGGGREGVVAEVPMGVRTFTGRAREIENLCQRLSANHPGGATVVSISGGSGVGKSALAIHVAHQMAPHYPDGQLYVNLRGSTPKVRPVAPAAALGRLLRSLGVDDQAVPVEADEAAGKLRSLIAGKRLLIMLDNALDTAQIRDLLPGDGASAVLLTSRRMLAELDGATHVRLDLLPEADCLELFAVLVGRRRVQSEPDAAEEVVRRCGHLPLAVCVAAARLNARRTWSVRTLADRLATDRHRLAELHVGDRAVQASFAVSYDELDQDQARLFRCLGLLANPEVGVGVAAALAGVGERQAENLLDQLVDLHMVDNHDAGRYRVHDLLRQFALERAQQEDGYRERERALRGALHWYLATARTACLKLNPDSAWRTECEPRVLLRPGANPEENAWIEAESPNFAALMRQAIHDLPDGPAMAVALAAALYLPLGYRRLWKEQLALSELALEAAGRTGDPLHLAMSLGDLGDVRSHLGRLSDAIEQLSGSLDAYRGIGHLRGQATQLDRLAGVFGLLGRFEESIDHYLRALALDRRQGDRFNEGITLSNLGLSYQKAGRFDEAIQAHSDAIAIHRQAEDPFGLGGLLGNLAEAWRLKGQPGRAAGLYKEALQADADARRSGTYDEAEHWWGLSRCHDDLGELEPARKSRRTAAAILHDLGLIDLEEKQRMDSERPPPTPEIIRRNT